MKDRTGQVWVVNEGQDAEVFALIVSKNEEESGHGATFWNVFVLDGWCPGEVDTWGESEGHDRRSFESQRGMRRVL